MSEIQKNKDPAGEGRVIQTYTLADYLNLKFFDEFIECSGIVL